MHDAVLPLGNQSRLILTSSAGDVHCRPITQSFGGPTKRFGAPAVLPFTRAWPLTARSFCTRWIKVSNNVKEGKEARILLDYGVALFA